MAKETEEKTLTETYDNILGDEGTLTVAEAAAEKPSEKESDTGIKRRPVQDAAYSNKDYLKEPGEELEEESETEPEEKPEKEDEEEIEGEEKEKEHQEENEEEEYEDIPERLVSAARRRGYTDEKIIELSERSPEVLEDLASADELIASVQKAAPSSTTKPEEKPEEKEEPKMEKIDVGVDYLDVDDPTKEVLRQMQETYNKMVDKVNSLGDNVNRHSGRLEDFQKQSNMAYIEKVDAFFDNAAKDLPGLGKASNLSPEQAEMRQNLHDIAAALSASGKYSIVEGLNTAIAAERGKLAENKVRKQVVSELNRRKSKFTARPSQRKMSVPRKPEKERALDVISQKFKEHGIE